MKVATWNVNSIKARLDHVIAWLEKNQPDVLMIQELKGEEFPHAAFEQIGYHAAAVTQKAYNGVATLSKHPIEVLSDHLGDPGDDDQARYLETRIQGLRMINIYLPNGNPVDTEKYPYKLAWMARLRQRIQALRTERQDFILAGDFNVIPEDRDCHNPAQWVGDALFRPETHDAYRRMIYLGLTDAFRALHHGGGFYSFWDYQAGAWPKNNGIRIDHILLSPGIADRLESCIIDKDPRGWDKASDHTPVVAVIDKFPDLVDAR